LGNSERDDISGNSYYRIPPGPKALGRRLFKEKEMNKRRYTKMIHEGKYVAEVEVEMVYTDEGWSPYISLDDAYKLDDIREPLKQGDVKSAKKIAKIYTLTPVSNS
jgi:hypothetical protein